MTLENAPINQTLTVKAIGRGRGAAQRLLELGIYPGSKVQVIARHPLHGPVIVKVSETEVAIGRHLAAFIEVQADFNGGPGYS